MGLKEYFILKSSLEAKWNESFLSTLHNTISDIYGSNTFDKGNLKMVSLDDVTSYMFNTFEKYGNSWKSNKLDNPKDYSDKLKEIKELVNERARLDSYFSIPGFKIEVIRVYMLKLIIQLQNEGFIREISKLTTEGSFEYPSAEDLLLQIFVSCVREFDEYYMLNMRTGKSIMLNNVWEIPPKTENEFYICKGTGNKIVGVISDKKFEHNFDLEGVFSIMVLFVYHIKKMHVGYISTKKTNAFNELIKNFDINDERYLDV